MVPTAELAALLQAERLGRNLTSKPDPGRHLRSTGSARSLVFRNAFLCDIFFFFFRRWHFAFLHFAPHCDDFLPIESFLLFIIVFFGFQLLIFLNGFPERLIIVAHDSGAHMVRQGLPLKVIVLLIFNVVLYLNLETPNDFLLFLQGVTSIRQLFPIQSLLLSLFVNGDRWLCLFWGVALLFRVRHAARRLFILDSVSRLLGGRGGKLLGLWGPDGCLYWFEVFRCGLLKFLLHLLFGDICFWRSLNALVPRMHLFKVFGTSRPQQEILVLVEPPQNPTLMALLLVEDSLPQGFFRPHKVVYLS